MKRSPLPRCDNSPVWLRLFASGRTGDWFGVVGSESRPNKTKCTAGRAGGPFPAPAIGGRVLSIAHQILRRLPYLERGPIGDWWIYRHRVVEGRRTVDLSNVVGGGFLMKLLSKYVVIPDGKALGLSSLLWGLAQRVTESR